MGMMITRSEMNMRTLERKPKWWLASEVEALYRRLNKEGCPPRSELTGKDWTCVKLAWRILELVKELPPEPDGRLYVGVRVDREDGRFYIPLDRKKFTEDDTRPTTVCRVASDAFGDDVQRATMFATLLADAWNFVEGQESTAST